MPCLSPLGYVSNFVTLLLNLLIGTVQGFCQILPPLSFKLYQCNYFQSDLYDNEPSIGILVGYVAPLAMTSPRARALAPVKVHDHGCLGRGTQFSKGAFIQPADIGWPTGNGKKLSNSQAC